MIISDDDGTAELLAQVRAERRHVPRLRTAQQRDQGRDAETDTDAEREREDRLDPLAAVPLPSADTVTLLIAEQAALEWDRANLVADVEADHGIEMEL